MKIRTLKLAAIGFVFACALPLFFNRAKNAVSFSQAQELLKLSLAELDDAIEVLDCGGLHPEARLRLRQAAALDAIALVTSNTSIRNAIISQAIALKNAAMSDMVN